MGLAYKCDRCGVIIPDAEFVARRLIHRNVVRGDTIFDVFNTRATINQFNKEITLCKECEHSFIHWFQSGKETK